MDFIKKINKWIVHGEKLWLFVELINLMQFTTVDINTNSTVQRIYIDQWQIKKYILYTWNVELILD